MVEHRFWFSASLTRFSIFFYLNRVFFFFGGTSLEMVHQAAEVQAVKSCEDPWWRSGSGRRWCTSPALGDGEAQSVASFSAWIFLEEAIGFGEKVPGFLLAWTT